MRGAIRKDIPFLHGRRGEKTLSIVNEQAFYFRLNSSPQLSGRGGIV
jgi:hypothetical protein